jgi:hypothetical protein
MAEDETPLAEPGIDRQDLLKASVLAIVSFLGYTVTRTRHFGGDDTVFALVVQRWLEQGEIERAFFHPHHLLYNPLVALCSWLVRAIKGTVFVLDVGATVSAAAAAAVVAGVYIVLRRFRIDDTLALTAAAVLALTGGMWRYATRMEVYTLAAAGVVVWLAAMSNERPSWRMLAAGFAAPWLGHSVLGLLVPPGAWLQRNHPRVLAIGLVTGLLVPGVIAAGLLALLHGSRSLSSLMRLFAGPESSRWLSLPDPLAAARAVSDLVGLQTYHYLPVFPPWTVTLFDILGGVATVALATLVVWGTVVSVRGSHRLGVTALFGVAFLVPLWLVWDVGNHEHAVAALPLLVVLAALGAGAVGRRTGLVVLTAIAATLLTVNGIGSVLLETQAHLSRTLVVADFVRDTVPEDGTLVMVGVDPKLRLSLPHLGGRRVVDLTSLVHSARRAGATPRAALDRWLRLASTADDPWLLEDPASPEVLDWVEGLGIPKAVWRDAVARMSLGRATILEADGVVLPKPVTLHRLEIGARRYPGQEPSAV